MEAAKVGTASELPPVSTLVKWVVAAAKDRPYKSLMTYEFLGDILQVNPQGTRGRSAILKAQRILLDEHNKYLANVTGKGYEIAHPSEHAGHVKKIRRAAIRKARKSHRVSIHGDFTLLTPDQAQELLKEQVKSGGMLAVMLRIESKRKIETVKGEMRAMSPRAIAKALTAKTV